MHDMRNGVCPLCQHPEIIEAEARDATSEIQSKPTVVAETVERGYFDGEVTADVRRYGALKMYVCRRCGYVQWFATAPGKIPVSPEARTRLITPPQPAGPYR